MEIGPRYKIIWKSNDKLFPVYVSDLSSLGIVAKFRFQY